MVPPSYRLSLLKNKNKKIYKGTTSSHYMFTPELQQRQKEIGRVMIMLENPLTYLCEEDHEHKLKYNLMIQILLSSIGQLIQHF